VNSRLQKKAAEYEVSIKMKREETQAIVKVSGIGRFMLDLIVLFWISKLKRLGQE